MESRGERVASYTSYESLRQARAMDPLKRWGEGTGARCGGTPRKKSKEKKGRKEARRADVFNAR